MIEIEEEYPPSSVVFGGKVGLANLGEHVLFVKRESNSALSNTIVPLKPIIS